MEFVRPRTVKEAVELLDHPSARAVAGATAFVGKPDVERLVDLTSLGLNYVEERSDGFHVGATTTIAELEESALAEMAGGYIRQACASLADTPLRNMITVGGNIACGHLWAHLPPVLMTLGARVLIAGKQEREATVYEVVSAGLGRGEFIREVVVPKMNGRGVFKKFALTSTDYAAVIVAVYRDELGLRTGVGGLVQPRRLGELEGIQKLTPERIEKAVSELDPVFHPHFDAEYRKHILKVLLQRAISEVRE